MLPDCTGTADALVRRARDIGDVTRRGTETAGLKEANGHSWTQRSVSSETLEGANDAYCLPTIDCYLPQHAIRE